VVNVRYQTHIVTSVTVGGGLAEFYGVPFSAGYFAGLVVGSLLPDIDEPTSFIGRRSFGLAYVIKTTFGHRGITHSLVVWIILSLLVYSLVPYVFVKGASLGYLFHIIGNYFSIQGIPLFAPLIKKKI
jgi:inner membrane protein